MRSYTTAQDTVLTGGSYRVSARALVANADGTMIDLTSAGGINWFDKIDLDTTIDLAVSQITITLRRGAGPTLSLSPLRTDSTVNVNGVGAYAPLIEPGRKIQIDVATTATGVAPISTDWQTLFIGYVDAIDFEADPISITARDLGAALADTWLEVDTSFGTGPGRAVELVMQDILDAVFGAGVIPLYTPTSPGFLITTYTQKAGSVMDALTALVGTIGWDVRYAWDSGTSQFRLTLAEPPRTATTPIYTFGPSRYIDVTKLTLDRTNIRNAIGVDYPVTDVLTGAESRAQIPTAIDTTSIAKYGRRYMGITEASGSPINSLTAAQNLAAAALADLKDPSAEQEIELHFDWRVELHDLDKFLANAVHYNTDQTWAAAGVRQTLESTKHRTRITARGAPAGSFLSWVGRGPNGVPIGKAVAPIAKVTPGAYVGDTSLTMVFDGVPATGGSSLFDFTIVVRRGGVATISIDSTVGGLTLPYTDTFTRDAQMALVAEFIVKDRVTGLSSMPAYYTIESSRAYVTNTGAFQRTNPYSDGNYAQQALDSGGTRLNSTAVDYASRPVNKFFAKGLSGNPDTFSSVPDDASYAKTITSRVSSGKPFIDFSESINLNKNAGNIPRSSGDATAVSTIVQSIDNSGNAASTMLDSGARNINKFYAKALSGNPDTADSIADGATTGVPTFNQRTGGGRGYTAIDSGNVLVAAGADFSRAYTNKQLDNIPDGSTYARPLATYMDSNRPNQLYRSTGAAAVTADLLAASMGVATANLFTNGNAEDGALGGSGPWVLSTGWAVVSSTTQVKNGSRSWKLDPQSGGGGATDSSSYQDIPLIAGRVYLLSAWMNCAALSGAGQGAFIHMSTAAPTFPTSSYTILDKVGDDPDTSIAAPSVGFLATGSLDDGTWHRVQCLFLCNVSTTIRCYLQVGYGGTMTGITYFDDVSLQEVPPTSAQGGARGYTALDSNARLASQRRNVMTTMGGLISQAFVSGTQTPITNPLSSSDTTITVSAMDIYVGSGGALSYAGGTVTGAASASPGTTNYVYLVDPTFSGAGVLHAVTDPRNLVNQDGVYYVGKINCITSSSGGGSVYCVAPSTPILLADGGERAAGDLRAGDMIDTEHDGTFRRGVYAIRATSTHDSERWRVVLTDGRVLLASPGHRVYVNTRGWMKVEDLVQGDLIVGAEPGTVRSSEPYDYGPVVQLSVDGAETYMSAGLLSHNSKAL